MNSKRPGFSPIYLTIIFGVGTFLLLGTYFIITKKIPPRQVAITGTKTYDKVCPTNPATTAKENQSDVLVNNNKPYSPVLIKEWSYYNNTKYNYEIQNVSNLWDLISYTTPESEADNINLRLKSDITPAESGFVIGVLEDFPYSGAKEYCENNEGNQAEYGFICVEDSSRFMTVPVEIGEVFWQKFEKNSVGLVPSGYLAFERYYKGDLYLIFSHGINEEDTSSILKTFKHLD